MVASLNFAFLTPVDPQLVRLGALAEQYFAADPNTCSIKLRQFGERLAQLVAAEVGLYVSTEERQLDLLRRLRDRGLLKGEVDRLFHELRRAGNEATHTLVADHRTALSNLKYARLLGIWFYRVKTKDSGFKPGSFVPPTDPAVETEALKQELEKLRAELGASLQAAELAQIAAQQEELRRQGAEELAREAEAKAQEALDRLAAIQAHAAAQPAQNIQQTIHKAQQVEIDLDERETRRLIDIQLRNAGWEVDSEQLTYQNGTRPQKGKNLAIAEWPTQAGRADYVLFVGLQAIALVEAKRQSKDVASAAIDQAKRYSRGFQLAGDATLSGSPWGEFKVPFVFATNGREFLQQLRTKSGIWFCDLRQKDNLRRPLPTWYSPQGLIDALAQDAEQAHQRLAQEGFNYGLELRDYQINAIQSVESALAQGQREILMAMATGTGKTKTCIALVYRLLKTKRFRRVLFLVDRKALREQTTNAFKIRGWRTYKTLLIFLTLKN